MYQAVTDNTCVCSAYATIFKKLCDMYDIECYYLLCKSERDLDAYNHAYNVCVVNNKKYYTDVTWNDTNYTDYHKYLLMSEDVANKKHFDSTIGKRTLYEHLYIYYTDKLNKSKGV